MQVYTQRMKLDTAWTICPNYVLPFSNFDLSYIKQGFHENQLYESEENKYPITE